MEEHGCLSLGPSGVGLSDPALYRFVVAVHEIVTNAVRHGSPPITTELECRGEEGMHVRVSDGSADAPVVRDLGHDAQSGRGLTLVDLLSSQWGVEPGAAGKAVWFRIGDASY